MKYYEIQIYEREETNERRNSIDVFSQKVSIEKADPMMIQKIVAVVNGLQIPGVWIGVDLAKPQPE